MVKPQHILQAALEILQHPSYDWSAGISVGKVAHAAGVDESTIRNTIGNKAKLVRALVRHALDGLQVEELTPDIFDSLRTRSVRDPNVFRSMRHLATEAVRFKSADPTLTSQMLLWSHGHRDPYIRDQLLAFYARWESVTAQQMHTLFEGLRYNGYQKRQGLEARDFALVVSVVVEGLSMRARLAPDQVPEDLAGNVLSALLATWIAPSDDHRDFDTFFTELTQELIAE